MAWDTSAFDWTDVIDKINARNAAAKAEIDRQIAELQGATRV